MQLAVLNEAVDDGAGNIKGTGITSGTIDYNTGAFNITLASTPESADDVYFNYRYNYYRCLVCRAF